MTVEKHNFEYIQPGKVAVLVDGQFGSTGKGLLAAYLALQPQNEVDVAATNASANAGHTTRFLNEPEKDFVCYHLPTFGVIQPDCEIYLNAGAIIDPSVLLQEIEEHGVQNRIGIHPMAAVITKANKHKEKGEFAATTKLASTQKGVGSALSGKILREAKLAKDCEKLKSFVKPPYELNQALHNGGRVSMEVPQGYSLSLNGPFYPYCLSGDSKILMDDESTKNMRDIRVGDLVMSSDKGVKVTNAVSNIWKRDLGNKSYFNIVTETTHFHEGNVVGAKYTGDHRIRTVKGVKKVKELSPGDLVYSIETDLSGDGLQIFLGSLLGDGTVCDMEKHTKRSTLSFTHGPDQSSYCEDKSEIMLMYLGGGTREIVYGESSFKPGNIATRYESSTSFVVRKLAKFLGCLGKKTPMTGKIVSMMDERALAIWYQDDGRLKRSRCVKGKHRYEYFQVIMHTDGFAKEEIMELADSLGSKFGIVFNVTRVKGRHQLYLSRKDNDKFFDMIREFIHEDLEYKLPDSIDCRWKFGEDISPILASEEVVEIVSRDVGLDKRRHSHCYDMEVENAHNFFVGNGTGFVNVENCTSRNCTVAAGLNDANIHPSFLGKVSMSLRTYPIRVGNIYDNEGKRIGWSGPVYSDQTEVTWEELGIEPEVTTVTKRIRRVFTWSKLQFEAAVKDNRPNLLFFNFANYCTEEEFQSILESCGSFPIEEPPDVLYGYGPHVEDVTSNINAIRHKEVVKV